MSNLTLVDRLFVSATLVLLVAAIVGTAAFQNWPALWAFFGLAVTYAGMVVAITTTPKAGRGKGYTAGLVLGFIGLLVTGIPMLVFPLA